MVEAGGLLGEGQGVGAPFVVDGDEALLYVDVGGPILAHGAELDQVALRCQLLQCIIKQLKTTASGALTGKYLFLWGQPLQRGIEVKEGAHVKHQEPHKASRSMQQKDSKHSARSQVLLEYCRA